MFVAVQLSLQHIWWELSNYLQKVWTNSFFLWSTMSLHGRIVCFCLMNMKYVIVISNLHIFCSLFPFFFSSFILSMHSCRCTWISTAELWVCLSQWWLFRTGDFDIALAVCGLYAKLSFNSCLKSCHIFVNVCLFPYCSWKCLKKWALRSIVVAPFTSDFAWKY